MTESETEEVELMPEVSVVHGAFDGASYALMVGVYVDEEMSGAERFLDRQFGDLLSGWRDIGRYSGALGTSVFAEPGRDVVRGAEPAGAYLVGLGSTLSLSRQQVTSAVQRALVDRCVRLYAQEGGSEARLITVGVSSSLLGVRNDDGLRVEDSVVGILEGVRDANRMLHRFEESQRLVHGVRVGFVEFVERYADRANLAAAAVRRAATLAGHQSNFGDLDKVTVTSADGALPSGASLIENNRAWRRFIISEQAVSGGATGPLAGGALTVDVSLLGRNARADRVTQRIDRASLDALMDRVTHDRDDTEALTTLRDRLVPNSMRAQFLTSSAIQLILDASTANYPWELLAASAVGASDQHPAAATGAILRMFAEAESRRTQPLRASIGRALVIGAGNVEGFENLPGVIEEAEEVTTSLRGQGIQVVELLDREKQPLDIAELNIKLLGDNQIIHIASHGVYAEGDPAATGAVLTKDLLFTADMVASLPIVPELVFLNCCDLGQIGQSRLVAGLARELMALGVRAVVGAGWRVNDEAAKAFAKTFYEELTSGRTLGDAVAKARASCDKGDESKTWASYQCYGDPTFVLRGRSAEVVGNNLPVSLSDLEARLGTLLTQVGDLSQPTNRTFRGRRERLCAVRADLEEWAIASGYADRSNVRRLLARTARELGEFDIAADGYAKFANESESGYSSLATKESSACDLQQAANCLARSAQEAARQAIEVADEGALLEALDTFPRAIALATGAIEVLNDDEGHSILASAYKKWATVDSERQAEYLRAAVDAYQKVVSRRRGDYGVENRVQIMSITDQDGAGELVAQLTSKPDEEATTVRSDNQAGIVDAAPQREPGFWSRAAAGDTALTELMVTTSDATRASHAADVIRSYKDAFERRSTFSERASTVDHLADVHDLLPEGDGRRRTLAKILEELKPWSLFAIGEESPKSQTGLGDARSGSQIRRALSTVKLTALPAACGDCLLLDYTGDDGEHRILIDGGLGSAFGEGLGAQLGTPESPTEVDVAVVTHVDADHIEGVLEALEEKRLEAHDIWFNGRKQLDELFRPTGSRSVRQGDALSELIPDDKRNRAVGGRAFVLPEDGAPPSIPLPGGASAVLLSPSLGRLKPLLAKWPEPTRGEGDSVERLIAAMEDETTRGDKTFGRDSSIANGSSIAFLFEHQKTSILFAADAHASQLHASIQSVLDARGQDKLHVWVFKVPHHGSRSNITDELLDLIEPEHILICTDGSKRFKHPNADAVDKLRRHYPKAPIYFTDDTEVTRERASRIEGELPDGIPVVLRR